jgi:NADH-quinone oxidoreductase subunit M
VFLGKLNPKYENIEDINGRELFTLIPLGILTIILGIYPMPVLNMFKVSMNYLIKLIP